MESKMADDSERMARHGRHLFERAKSLGWQDDDGEGPLEFIIRMAYDTGWNDHANRNNQEP